MNISDIIEKSKNNRFLSSMKTGNTQITEEPIVELNIERLSSSISSGFHTLPPGLSSKEILEYIINRK